METTVEILNKIANKLGDENADQYTTVAQALGSIANALGNADPDKIQTVPEALEEILAVAGGGGGENAKILGRDVLQIDIPFDAYTMDTPMTVGSSPIMVCDVSFLEDKGIYEQLEAIDQQHTELDVSFYGFTAYIDPNEGYLYEPNSSTRLDFINDLFMLGVWGNTMLLFFADGTAKLAVSGNVATTQKAGATILLLKNVAPFDVGNQDEQGI